MALTDCKPTHEALMKKSLFTLALSATAVFSAAPAFADLALATSKNCMACHAVDKKLVGPAYKDVAAKYKGDKTAVDKLTAKVLKGGSGVWGAVPMPANAQVNEAEAKKLVTWVLGLK
jgi:cytochrome c